jgi:hypothetical protein
MRKGEKLFRFLLGWGLGKFCGAVTIRSEAGQVASGRR